MAPLLLPRLSRGTALTLRVIVVAVPALVAVAVAAVILFLALFMNERRQRYALRAANSVFALASGLMKWPDEDTAATETESARPRPGEPD
ncbi:hypothetical protein [Amycolatopsis sp. NPDC021455]|uniref:hypothetical protein n=1 Tax=Amycolatopsis sp. NPDC021455 TaxID=3154901 RepID=UPI0033D62C0A